MTLHNKSIPKLGEYIKSGDKKVVIFGAGAIGRALAPYIFKKYDILDKVLFYVDNDTCKQGELVETANRKIKINSADSLKDLNGRETIIIITISQYSSVLEQLNAMDNLDETECYILPVICICSLPDNDTIGVIKNSDEALIPKVIHYIWIGENPLNDLSKKCIDTWRKFCPDYQIVKWSEENYDFGKNEYMKLAYESKRWAFVSDFARLDILYNHGGIYMDTDVMLLKPLDELLYQTAYCSAEKWNLINSGGGCGTVKHGKAIKAMLDFRSKCNYIDSNGRFSTLSNVYYDTVAMENYGYEPNGTIQSILDMNIYSWDYFHTYDYMSCTNEESQNAFSVHLFNGGWIDEDVQVQRINTQRNYQKILSLMNKK